jgi:hypothetical protein
MRHKRRLISTAVKSLLIACGDRRCGESGVGAAVYSAGRAGDRAYTATGRRLTAAARLAAADPATGTAARPADVRPRIAADRPPLFVAGGRQRRTHHADCARTAGHCQCRRVSGAGRSQRHAVYGGGRTALWAVWRARRRAASSDRRRHHHPKHLFSGGNSSMVTDVVTADFLYRVLDQPNQRSMAASGFAFGACRPTQS